VIAIVLGFIAVMVAWMSGMNALSRIMSGWKALAQQFPATDVHKFGGKYKGQRGDIGRKMHVQGVFLIELAQEGLLVTPDFAARSPILIPWSAIRDVSEVNLLGFYSTVLITVGCEKPMSFHLPADALQAIHENVPAEKFHKAGSFLDLINQRAANQPSDQSAANEGKSQSWEDIQTSLVDSWWGAVAALMLAQAYSFILLQGLIHFTVLEPVTLIFLLVIALSQAGLLRVMDKYLKTHDWKTAFRFIHSPVETLKFCAAILATGAYVYLLTGHRPVPRDPALYKDVGIIRNLAFQLFNLAMSFVLTGLWKLTSKIGAARLAGADAGAQTGGASGLTGGIIATVMGILFIVISCHAKELFYVFGVIGYGMIVLALSAALTRDPSSWVIKKKTVS
jgi:hypothetical protein